ncbi:hypothetical protein BH23GEM9_BH23GEM9_07950 [soil metagenome]
MPLAVLPTVPLLVHARYTRLEILAACGVGTGSKVMTWQTGVYHARELNADLLAFTLDKTSGQFSPTTRYRDYAISRELIHWESQSVTREQSETGIRFQQHETHGSHVLLIARLNAAERAFYFIGPASYVSHVGELPMAITWRLLAGSLARRSVSGVRGGRRVDFARLYYTAPRGFEWAVGCGNGRAGPGAGGAA